MTCFTHHPRAPTPPPQPSFANPFGLPPYFAHFLPAAAAAAPNTTTAASLHSDAESVADSNNSDSAAGSPTVPSSSALDLSPKSLNVVDSAEDWSVDQVVDFVRGVEGCEEYAEVNITNQNLSYLVYLYVKSHLGGKKSGRMGFVASVGNPAPTGGISVFPGI